MDAIKERAKRRIPVIVDDEQELRTHVSDVVRQSVEETPGGLPEADAGALRQAKRYVRNIQRASVRAGS
ncbi:hypothetical protein [uncultured Desulfovibrio sp.]|uniref:hypothetical protein n=1 Tax=uncultured Desulfovibrio sp. TaxID=167968 RepID=UPI00039FC94E|nr:hypothetical protein [uncultured Desulfovibrio sp.]